MHLHLSCWPAGLISTFHSSSVSPLATGNVKNLKSVWTAASTDDSDIFILFFVPPVFLLRVALMFWTTYNQFETGNQRTCLHWNNFHINLPSAEPECWSLWTCSGTDPLDTVPGGGEISHQMSHWPCFHRRLCDVFPSCFCKNSQLSVIIAALCLHCTYHRSLTPNIKPLVLPGNINGTTFRALEDVFFLFFLHFFVIFFVFGNIKAFTKSVSQYFHYTRYNRGEQNRNMTNAPENE